MAAARQARHGAIVVGAAVAGGLTGWLATAVALSYWPWVSAFLVGMWRWAVYTDARWVLLGVGVIVFMLVVALEAVLQPFRRGDRGTDRGDHG